MSIILAVLTVTVFLFPIDKTATIAPGIQSLLLIPDIESFSLLFTSWVIIVFITAFLGRNNTARANPLPFVISLCCYALVFLGFWTRFSYGSTYGQYAVSQARYLLVTGHIPFSVASFFYRGYPTLDLLTSSLGLVSGMSLSLSGNLLLLLFSVMFTVFMLLVFKRILHSWAYAWLGAVLLITGNQTLSRNLYLLWGGVFSFPLLAMLLFLISSHQTTSRLSGIVMILFAVLSLTYLPTPTFFLLFLLAFTILTRRLLRVMLPLLALFITLNIYLSISAVNPILTLLYIQSQQILSNPTMALESTFFNAIRITSTGETFLPLWGKITQLVWVAILLPLALVLSLKKFIRSWIHAPVAVNDDWLVAGLTAALIGGIASGFMLPGGFQLVYRLIMYAPFFSIPLMLEVFRSFSGRRRRMVLASLIIILISLSLPTFLVNHKAEGTLIDAVSSQEAFSFVSTSFQYGSGLLLYSAVQDASGLNLYYLPEATYVNEGEGTYLNPGANEISVWDTFDSVLSSFVATRREAVYVWSPRIYYTMESVFGVSPSDAHWAYLHGQIYSRSNLIYNNGNATVFYPKVIQG